VVPTLCRLMDLTCPDGMDGTPLDLSGAAAPSRTVFAASAPSRERYRRNPWMFINGLAGRWSMARRNGIKLIRIPHPEGPHWQAYDLSRDPRELVDVYDSARFGALREELESWLTAVSGEDRRGSARARLGRPSRDALRALGYLD